MHNTNLYSCHLSKKYILLKYKDLKNMHFTKGLHFIHILLIIWIDNTHENISNFVLNLSISKKMGELVTMIGGIFFSWILVVLISTTQPTQNEIKVVLTFFFLSCTPF